MLAKTTLEFFVEFSCNLIQFYLTWLLLWFSPPAAHNPVNTVSQIKQGNDHTCEVHEQSLNIEELPRLVPVRHVVT